MSTLRKALYLILLAAFCGLPLAAQLTDCAFTRTFTGDLNAASSSNISGNTPCVNWRITFSVSPPPDNLTTTVTFQTSPDNTNWTSVPATICSASVQPPCTLQGSNPLTGTTQGMSLFAAYGSYVRVITSGSAGTGTGTIRGYGAKGATASALPGGGGGGGSGTVTNVSTTSPILGGPITGSGTISLDTTKIPQKFFGTAAPTSVATNLPGDFFTDTTAHNEYVCNAPSGTPAPACTSVTAAGWLLLNGGGGVTSVGLVGTANQITVTGASPITGSGSWTLSFPVGGVTLPGTTSGTFSGGLTGNVTGNVTGTAATITGALALANTPLTARGDILIATTATPILGKLAKGTQYQTLQGGATDPGYDAVHLDQSTAITGILPQGNGGSGVANTATLTLGSSNVNLATLGTGLVVNTTTTGALSIARGHNIAVPLTCPTTSASDTAEVCNTTPTYAPVAGDTIIFQADVANTGAFTLNVNSLGAKPVTKRGTIALVAGDIAAAPFQTLMTYDGTEWEMHNGANPVAYTNMANTFSQPQTVSANSALSAPAVAATGTWITLGTATTTKPYILIEPAGVTSTAWSVNGTGIGVNAALLVFSGTYTSGITTTGTVGQTCTLTAFNNGGTNVTATVALTGSNVIAGGTALVITNSGQGAIITSAPTSATAGNGTATCSGTATVATSTAGGNLIDLQQNGISKFSVTSAGGLATAGNLTAVAISAASASSIRWAASTQMAAPSNGVWSLKDSAGTSFVRAAIGPDTSSFPALCPSGTAVLDIRVGGACTSYANLNAQDVGVRSLVGIGSAPAVDATSCTGATIGTGATNSAGTITGLPTATCTIVLTLSGTTAPHGWSCQVSNQTTANLFRQTASAPTTATLSGVSVSGDVLNYGCTAF